MLKRTVFTALAAAAVSTSALVAPAMLTPAAAQASLNVVIGVPPPAPVYEVVPAPRAGYVWAPGYYRWEGGRHVWTWAAGCPSVRLPLGPRPLGSRSEWLAARRRPMGPDGTAFPTATSIAPTTALGDRDHDGVPNRYDSRPDNPYRR